MSAPTLGVDLGVDLGQVAELVGDFDLPCEAVGHEPQHPQTAQWWSRITHRGCPKVEVCAVCDLCKTWDESVLARTRQRRALFYCSCGDRAILATDVEMTFTPIRCAP